MNAAVQGRPSRSLLGFAALAYTAFVIYGSLVPLEFRALPWETAVARFSAMPFLQLGIGSRADWVANLLLFIPLAFLWMGVVAAGGNRLRTGLAALLIVPLATMLSLGIEFTQLYFPQRTVSQNDVFAETLGGMLGVSLWLAAGARFERWLGGWQRVQAHALLAERLAWVYLAGLLVYNVLPLDLTLSAVEIFHKWREGRVNLVPFAGLPADTATAIYALATDVLIWVPLALLWRLDGTRAGLRVWGMVLVTAVGLEALQLFVYSRVSDVTDVFTAALGAALGVWAGRLGRRCLARADQGETGGVRPDLGAALPLGLAAAWSLGLLFVFWFPFDFRTDSAFLAGRIDFVRHVPFEVYYFGTEYRAATEVLRKTLFFAPLGALLGWGVAAQPWRWRGVTAGAAMLILAGLPALVEGGQVLLPAKIPDTTDWLLAWLGGLAGYAATRRVLRTPYRRALADAPPAPGTRLNAARGWHLPLALLVLAAALWSTAHAPFLPYNVRELLPSEHRAWSALLLALACYWFAVWPVWLARRRISGVARLVQLPLGLLAYGLVGFLLLRGAVADESLHDLVGAPVWGGWAAGELALRWTLLAALPGALLYLAVQLVRRARGLALGPLHFAAALPVLALAYGGIVAYAATDNLVELIATPRPLGFIALALWLLVLFLGAVLIASPAARGWGWRRLAVIGATLPLAAGLLALGLAGDIEKYGQHFSALQFLLSPDRDHYAGPVALWFRYVLAHALVTAALASLQWPHLRSAPQPHRQASHALH